VVLSSSHPAGPNELPACGARSPAVVLLAWVTLQAEVESRRYSSGRKNYTGAPLYQYVRTNMSYFSDLTEYMLLFYLNR